MQIAITHKTISDIAWKAVDKCARQKYGNDCDGVRYTDPEIIIDLEDAADPSDADQLLSDIASPVLSEASLTVTTDVGALIVDEDVVLTADGTYIKYVKLCLMVNDSTGALTIGVQEKTTGDYGAMPGGYTFIGFLKEYSIAVSGSTLTTIEDFT